MSLTEQEMDREKFLQAWKAKHTTYGGTLVPSYFALRLYFLYLSRGTEVSQNWSSVAVVWYDVTVLYQCEFILMCTDSLFLHTFF